MTPVPPPPPPDLPRGTRLVAGLGYSTVTPDLDFETFSSAGFTWDEVGQRWTGPPGAPAQSKGLPVVGAANYTLHPTCEVLTAYYDLKDGGGRRPWRPGLPPPVDLFAYLATGGLIEAWNVGFERWVWENVCVPRMGWPPVRPEQWRCAMAKARAFALPGALGKAGEVLALNVQKDKEGKRLLDKFSVPRKPTKADPRTRIVPLWSPEQARAAGRVLGIKPAVLADDIADSIKLLSYNGTDIAAEAAVSAVVPDLEGEELAWWQVDQAINHRGVQVDLATIDGCIAVIREAHQRYNAELLQLTGVDAASKVQQLLGWLHGRGVHVDSLDEDSVAAALKRTDLAPEVRRVLEIRAAIGSASVKKVFAMRNRATPAGRMHDLFIYFGARTGRCLAAGQPVLVRAPDGTVLERPIEQVRGDDLLWDGAEWVTHGGVVCSGEKEVVEHDGVVATPEHEVFVSDDTPVRLEQAKAAGLPIHRGNPCSTST